MSTLQKYDPNRLVIGLASDDEQVKAAAAADPGTALSTISQVHGQGGKRLPVLARALDTVLGLIADPKEARQLLNDHLTPEAQAQMIAVHGDLPSVAVQLADPDVIVAALEIDTDMESLSLGSALRVSLLIRAWAQNAKDRPDWDELLCREIADSTLRDLLIAAVYDDADEVESAISADLWKEVGLDPIDSAERLAQLLEEDELPRFTDLDIAEARKRLRELRQTFEKVSDPKKAMDDLSKDVDI